MILPFTISWRSFLILLFAVIFDPGRCITLVTDSVAAEFPPAIKIIEGKTTQGFPYLMGGVGSDERDAMEEKSKAYNVRLAFAERRGPYLADVKLVIEDAKKAEIVSVATDGPWFFIQLPPGRYAVKATFKGRSKTIDVLSIEKGKTVRRTLAWDLGEGS